MGHFWVVVFVFFDLEYGRSLQVSKLGFGCTSLSGAYKSPLSEEEAISLIKEAFEKGVSFFDTSDIYGPFTNEILVGKVCFL